MSVLVCYFKSLIICFACNKKPEKPNSREETNIQTIKGERVKSESGTLECENEKNDSPCVFV